MASQFTWRKRPALAYNGYTALLEVLFTKHGRKMTGKLCPDCVRHRSSPAMKPRKATYTGSRFVDTIPIGCSMEYHVHTSFSICI